MPSDTVSIDDPHRHRWHWTPEAENNLRRRLASQPTAMILESGPGYGELGRWSIFAWKPRATFTVRGDQWTLDGTTGAYPPKPPSPELDPIDALRQLIGEGRRRHATIKRNASIDPGRFTFPFQGGWVGFVGYDCSPQFERTPRRHPGSPLPDMYWQYFSSFFLIDRVQGVIHFLNYSGGASGRPDRVDDWLKSYDRSEPPAVAPALSAPKSDWTKAEYVAAVERLIEYVRAGDVFQANLTHRFSTRLHPDWAKPGRIADLWERCVAQSPAPFSALISTPEWSILSTSPERFLLVEPYGRVETRPIKGTRPRGKTASEDAAWMAQLLSSAKDRAELAMIVDLERNDLGRVCRFGSVKVAQHAALESYSNVHHLVSVVEGKLRGDCDVVDLLAASFPGGSITGAPKIRAMEIIDELEACSRGVYTGAIGYISDHGRADFNIAIRTLVVEGDRAHYHVGGGITVGSEPEAEYEETLAKGSKLMRVLTEIPGEPGA